MANNGKDTKATMHIARGTHSVSNGEKCKIHNIDLCKEGLLLEKITTKSVGEHDLTTRNKYIMVRLDN